MIFRNADYSPLQATSDNAELTEYYTQTISEVKSFAEKIMPAEQREKLENIFDNLTIVICDKERRHKCKTDGQLKDVRLSGAAHKFFTEVRREDFSCAQGLAFFAQADRHTIAHEALHAFSSDMGKTDNGGFIKTGAKYAEVNHNYQTVGKRGEMLNEAITDALASRFHQKIGPGQGASYGAQVLTGDLFIGDNVENNFFIQDVYWKKGEKFAQDFNKTVKTSAVKFEDYLEDYELFGSDEENQKADELWKGAIEYKLRKANTAEDIDKTYAFQQKVLNFYKTGGFYTGFIEDNDIKRLDNMLIFAEKLQKQCKSDLTARQMTDRFLISGKKQAR